MPNPFAFATLVLGHRIAKDLLPKSEVAQAPSFFRRFLGS